jgi:hypothetical protein
VWQPSANVYSLCQRLAGSICGHGLSKTAAETAGNALDEARRASIKKAIESSSFSSVHDLSFYKNILVKHGIENPSEEELIYAKKYTRFREKQDFLEHLTGNTPSHFLDYMGKIMPAVLNELQKSVSLSQLVSKFFEMFHKIVTCIPDGPELNDPVVHKQTIKELTTHINTFMEFFYECIHETSKRHGTVNEQPYMTTIFEFIFGFALGLSRSPKYKGNGYHEEIQTLVASLNPNDREQLWKDISKIQDLSKKGFDERHWPVNETISKVFVPHLRSKFSK